MSNLAIKVEGLGKRYRLGQTGYKTLRESITGIFKKSPSGNGDYIWAIKDIWFEVEQGEVVGIIGANGAGKTTLLKVLSRITPPTEGKADLWGLPGSLLEVGTGFHPELTGRENIYINGAVLGMKRAEIKSKFDEIVEFAEVEQFVDTPLKRYSSGMQVRLAFSVAAHLELKIMLVDEVLAVGDFAFQKRCFGKMGDMARSGRTILFVSHNMQAVSMLCDRGILLDKGHIVKEGPTTDVIENYLQSKSEDTGIKEWGIDDAPGTEAVKALAIRILNHEGQVSTVNSISKPIMLELDLLVAQSDKAVSLTFQVFNSQGICLFNVSHMQDGGYITEKGLHRCRCEIPAHLLNQGQHWVSALGGIDGRYVQFHLNQVLSFSMYDDGERRGGLTSKGWTGVVRPVLQWTIEKVKSGDKGGSPLL